MTISACLVGYSFEGHHGASEPQGRFLQPSGEGMAPFQLRRMSMDIQQIGLLSNGDLDAVVGGMMNNHQGDPL